VELAELELERSIDDSGPDLLNSRPSMSRYWFAPWLASIALSLSCQRQPAHGATTEAPPAHPAWPGVPRERWAGSLQGYESPLRGIATRSGAAQGEFTDYIAAIHDRLHPIFAERFLASLEELPESHPLNQERLNTWIEVVLNRDGRIARLGIVHSSGVEDFDIAALEAMSQASPFGKPPRKIVSIDGRVYVRWQLWRHPYYGCSTDFGKAHILRPK
jgi:TonB family protein